MPIFEIHCGALDVSINAYEPSFAQRPDDAVAISDPSYDFVSTMFLPTSIMQNIFNYRLTPQDETDSEFAATYPVTYLTRSLEDDFSNAPVRFNPMCGIVSGSTAKFSASCDNLVGLRTSAACDESNNNVDYNIVPYVLLRYIAMAVMSDSDGWRVFKNTGDASWNTATDIVPKLFADAQSACFDSVTGVISNAFKTERALTASAAGVVTVNDNRYGCGSMSDLIYRTMIAEESTRFHVQSPTLVFNPMPFAAGDCLSFLFTIGMGDISYVGDVDAQTSPNDLVIKVRLECRDEYTSGAHTSITSSVAAGVADNVKLVVAEGATAAHTDFYAHEDQLPSIDGEDVLTHVPFELVI
jgi:hypothetical protein